MSTEQEKSATRATPTTASENDRRVMAEMHRRSRRAFITGGLAALAAYGGWRWLLSSPEEDGALAPLRRVLELNRRVAEGYFSGDHLAATFPRSRAGMPRVNGDIGLGNGFDPTTWSLRALSPRDADGAPGTAVTMEEIRALPRVEMVTELKCIEGWSVVVAWAGARLADFADRYRLATRSGAPHGSDATGELARYVAIETPDREYFVGIDWASAMHPQTLLCYEMNGEPLSPPHGAPLRLVIPTKYGIKNIKRIGLIRFTDERPRDYWASEGYDWYAGL